MSDTALDPLLTDRFGEALALALDLHRSQLRKSTTVPYFSHLMSVAALVLEDGGDEDEAIAALLHDALEDCADRITAAEIERRFGDNVRIIVEGCTDTPPDFSGDEKPAWKPRKTLFLERLKESGIVNRVSLADKVHNARSILRDHRIVGDKVWERFTPKVEEVLWYYRGLAAAYRHCGASGFLIDELERTIDQLEERTDLTMAK